MSTWTAWITTALLAAPAPQEIETLEYRIRKGDTCAGIARELYGDAERHDVIHQYNRWLGAQLPHHLEEGQVLVVPKSLPPALPDAEVTAARRKVDARPPETPDWSRAHPGLDLFRGWRVNTRDAASAEITFRDDSRLELRENTLVIIYGGTQSKARRETAQATLDRGALRSRLGAYTGKGDRAVTVTTPSAVAELEGGNNLVTVDDGGTSRVANHGEGKSAVRAPGKAGPKVRIKPKMGSKVDKGKAPTKPKPLPPTPSWIERGPTTFAAAGERGGTIHGEWGAIAGAASYRVEVSPRPGGGELLVARTVPATVHRFEVQGLPAGSYFVSVAAIDDDTFESPPSEPLELRVVPVGLRTPGAATLPDAATDQDPETSESSGGPIRVLRGTRLDVPRELRCRVDDGELSRSPVLDTAGEHALHCVTDDDRPVPGFAVSVVDATIVAAAEAHAAVRRETATAVFAIEADVPLPKRLWVEAPEGFLVGSPTPTQTAGQWQVRVYADETAPEQAVLRVMADAGGEPVALGQLSLTVDDPPPERQASAVVTAAPRRPERHMIEGGVYVGTMLPSTRHNLYQPRADEAVGWQRLRPAAADIGVRVGYYPIRWVGLELENGLAPTRVREDSERATMFMVRGQLLGQLPWRVTPTVHAGAGVLGVAAGSTLGRDFDPALHFGAGLKAYPVRWAVVRLDVRDVITEARGEGAAHSIEILLGFTAVLGRHSAAAPAGSKRSRKRKRSRQAPRTNETAPTPTRGAR